MNILLRPCKLPSRPPTFVLPSLVNRRRRAFPPTYFGRTTASISSVEDDLAAVLKDPELCNLMKKLQNEPRLMIKISNLLNLTVDNAKTNPSILLADTKIRAELTDLNRIFKEKDIDPLLLDKLLSILYPENSSPELTDNAMKCIAKTVYPGINKAYEADPSRNGVLQWFKHKIGR